MFGFSQKIIDPVCGMKLDKKTEFSSENEGAKYYFCSENCKNQFDADTKKYIAQKNVPAKKSCCD